ncbi:GNAT family N-acetyltransferase [Lewinella cohaerens]|uniref:GNAT family N-acetyltransferase n=1 Tax=Lewinella cohaerens TaxID=70995 RepID=UPI00037150B7|nr:GNAT family N-acetyltransferase [Lewinella cohaerens]
MSEFKITTDRLLLRKFQKEDALGFFRMNNDPLVLQYTGDVPFTDMAAAEAFLTSYQHYQKCGYGRWTVLDRTTEEYLGFCGLKYHPKSGDVDLGFRFHRKFWGRGYATEAATACLQYGFTTLNIPCVIGRAQTENVASIRVLEKIGMQFVETFDFEGKPGVLYKTCRD